MDDKIYCTGSQLQHTEVADLDSVKHAVLFVNGLHKQRSIVDDPAFR